MPDTRPGGPHLRGRGTERQVLQRPLPAVPGSARLARVTARVACRAWRAPEAEGTAALVASELVTTALAHGSGPQLTLRVLMTSRRMRFELHDPSGRLTTAPEPEHDDGCSAQVLAAACVRWGVEPRGTGAQLFAEVAL